jgi:hypothetical protein
MADLIRHHDVLQRWRCVPLCAVELVVVARSGRGDATPRDCVQRVSCSAPGDHHSPGSNACGTIGERYAKACRIAMQ